MRLLCIPLIMLSIFTFASDIDVEVTPVIPGVTNGTISLTINGGVAPYDIQWSGPGGFVSTAEDLIGLPAGTYTLEITDAFCGNIQTEVVIDTQLTSGLAPGPDQFKLGVYPNPAGDYVIATFDKIPAQITEVWISTLSGARIENQFEITEAGKIHVPLHELAAGKYILSVLSDEGVYTAPFIRR